MPQQHQGYSAPAQPIVYNEKIQLHNGHVEKQDVVKPGQDSEERVSKTIVVQADDEHNKKHSFESSVSFSSNKQKEGHSAWEAEKNYSKADDDFLDRIRGNTGYSTGPQGGGYKAEHHGGSVSQPGHGGKSYEFGKKTSFGYGDSHIKNAPSYSSW